MSAHESPPSLEFVFQASILPLEGGTINHCLPLPDHVGEAYRAAGVRRVIATLNGHACRRAIMNRADGSRMLVLGLPLLKDIGAVSGDTVSVYIEPDPDPDFVEICEEFVEVLEQDDAAAARFYSMTRGMQRSLALYVNTAKRSETRIKRALELALKLRSNTLHGDTQKNREK
ncbi:MAG: YdeI/OmpD-associated family protein [Bacteroidia bacterium]|nr:YdeI/OmpD-associated family protein [Bacteroidia bacterium]